MGKINLDYLQIIPLLTLTLYFFYMTYYYAAPMFWLKVLLFYTHIRYRGSDVRFAGGEITIQMKKCGKELVVERHLEMDPTSRFFAMTVCSEYKSMLREIRTGVPAAEEKETDR